ncbi:MAG: hydrophobe/amphiphile efflux-3 (HAE3) family transporter [Eubacteriales bacterium]|nr:hydrophobe/amphiphile efflux-3 (HAE3) family transporter [Eubacteriales bacterium]
MNKVFRGIGNLIEKKPLRTLLIAIVIFSAFIAGVSNMMMATGNETLVQSDNEVFLSNKQMEDSFGGDSILVLFTEETQGSLFTLENIRKMWNVEQRFQYEEDIFSIMSTASIVHQMTQMQSVEIKKQVLKLSEGLEELQTKMAGLAFGALASAGEKVSEISRGLATFHSKSDMMVADIPGTQAELDNILYDENQKLRPLFANVVVDEKNSLMAIKLAGNLGSESKDEIADALAAALEKEGFSGVSYVMSGKPVLDSSLRGEMKINMVKMVALAVVLMLAVLGLVFKVRWRMLSLGIIMVSVIATIGLMGILSTPITMVSMAVFPILIGLGIDYSIQFHNRFEEEKSVKKTVSQIGKAVAIAVFATVLGFISLYASPVPMIQDFGKMLTIGVIISFLGSIFLLLPILFMRHKNDIQKEQPPVTAQVPATKKETILERALKRTTKNVIRFSIPILVIVAVLSVMGFMTDGDVGVETDIESFMPQNMQALKDIHLIRDTVGSTDQVILYMSASEILTEENIQWIQQKTNYLEEKYSDIIVDTKSIDTLVSNLAPEPGISPEDYIELAASLPRQQVGMFVNEGNTESVILLNIRHLAIDELREFILQLKADLADAPMKVQITGKSVLDVEMVNGLTSGRVKMTIIGLALVFAALVVIYKNPFKALIPILPVVMIIGMSGGIMYLLNIKYTPITATLGALVLGMGTEMTVMLLERYLEERKTGKDKLESMMVTVTMIGKAIVASGLTTIGGFSVLMASEFIILRDFGFMTVINIALALFSTFVVLPAIIILLDRFIFSRDEVEKIRLIRAAQESVYVN